MAIRPCQRGYTTANSLQANALGEFAGTSHSQSLPPTKKLIPDLKNESQQI